MCVDFRFRPTFKTATPTSRTQLKQQLQREQLQELERQELERRENERKLSMQCNGIANNNNNNIDQTQTQIAHSSHSTNPQQLQVPRGCGTVPHLYASSPTPSTSTDGSDFASGQFSNHSSSVSQQSDQPNAPLKVPLHIGVDLPPQVLKVCTRQKPFLFFLVISFVFRNIANYTNKLPTFFRFAPYWRIQLDTTSFRSKKIRCDNI